MRKSAGVAKTAHIMSLFCHKKQVLQEANLFHELRSLIGKAEKAGTGDRDGRKRKVKVEKNFGWSVSF